MNTQKYVYIYYIGTKLIMTQTLCQRSPEYYNIDFDANL